MNANFPLHFDEEDEEKFRLQDYDSDSGEWMMEYEPSGGAHPPINPHPKRPTWDGENLTYPETPETPQTQLTMAQLNRLHYMNESTLLLLNKTYSDILANGSYLETFPTKDLYKDGWLIWCEEAAGLTSAHRTDTHSVQGMYEDMIKRKRIMLSWLNFQSVARSQFITNKAAREHCRRALGANLVGSDIKCASLQTMKLQRDYLNLDADFTAASAGNIKNVNPFLLLEGSLF